MWPHVEDHMLSRPRETLTFFNLKKCFSQVWLYTPSIPALERQRQVDLCEFEASLIYRVTEFQDSQGYVESMWASVWLETLFAH